MPLYEYQCEACSHRFEVIQKFSDVPIAACPRCGGAVHKMQSAPAFQFKGSGWYITDYAKKGEKADGKPADGGATPASEASTSAKGDSSDGKSTAAAADKAAPAPSTPKDGAAS